MLRIYIHLYIRDVRACRARHYDWHINTEPSAVPPKPHFILAMDIQMISFEAYFTIRPIPKFFFEATYVEPRVHGPLAQWGMRLYIGFNKNHSSIDPDQSRVRGHHRRFFERVYLNPKKNDKI